MDEQNKNNIESNIKSFFNKKYKKSIIKEIELVKERRNGSLLFFIIIEIKGHTTKRFIRVWKKEDILIEWQFHKDMFENNVNVPEPSESIYDIENEYYFYYEKSIWKDSFWMKIKKSWNIIVKDIDFNIIKKHLSSFIQYQKLNSINTLSKSEYLENIEYNRFIEEYSADNEMIEIWKKIIKDIDFDRNNFSIVHGDLNLFNIMHSGIIDFEDTHLAFPENDLASIFHNLTFINKKPPAYLYTNEQLKELILLYENVFDFDINQVILEKFFWWTIWLKDFPEIRDNRIKILKEIFDKNIEPLYYMFDKNSFLINKFTL